MTWSMSTRHQRGFSLIELVIVIAILGILAAIAVPRMSRGAAGATSAQLRSDLAVMRSAIELYYAEHNNNYPAVGTFADQMVNLFTDVDGNTNATKTDPFIYGPYLKAIPTLRIGPEKGTSTIGATAASGTAWVYDAANGTITPNTGLLTDDAGVLYTAY